MNEGNYYIIALEKELQEYRQDSLLENVAAFQDLITVQVSDFLQSYLDKDIERLYDQLTQQRKMRKAFTNILNRQNQIAVLAGQFVQTFNIFNKLFQNMNQRNNFAEEMQVVLRSRKNAKELLLYMYKHPHAQHGEIVENTNIAKSSLSDLLRVLEKIQCVTRISLGKCSFYELTLEGRTFVEDLQPDIRDEFFIDAPIDYMEKIKIISKMKSMQKKTRLDNEDMTKVRNFSKSDKPDPIHEIIDKSSKWSKQSIWSKQYDVTKDSNIRKGIGVEYHDRIGSEEIKGVV